MNAPANIRPLLIPDLQTGLDYLSEITLANPVMAEQQLICFVDALLNTPPAPGIMLTLLEQVRVPICFVEEEMARLYHNKPLTLTEPEDARFQQVLAAWRKMHQAYVICAQHEKPVAENLQRQAVVMASILHRCIYYTGMIILEHYRARRDLPQAIWLELHSYYEAAEASGVAYTPVEDTLENSFQATHCAAAYTALLLIDIASPYSNSVHNLNLIRRWAALWAPLISIHPLDDDLEIPPYIVELKKDAPLHPSALAENPGNDTRRLDTTRLGLQINHMLSQLRLRISPSQLGLGEETSGHATQLLMRLSRPWTQSVSPRKFRRFATEGFARVAIGFDAIYFFVSGKKFAQPANASNYSRGEFDQLFTFGDRAAHGQTLTLKSETDFTVDNWSVINHSANGFRLARLQPRQKIRHGQLMAVCPHDGQHFLLAQTNWLMQEDSGEVILGIATLPGVPVGIGVRFLAGNGGVNAKLVEGFLLPPVPAFKEEGTIILPAGMYHPTRVLEVFSGDKDWQLRMQRIIQRGTDFDRISFQALDLSSSSGA